MCDLSVIMATYNDRSDYLMASVNSILRQSINNHEVLIVIEPGDGNAEYLQQIANDDKRLRILQNDLKLGVSGSRNRAIKESTGKYIAIIDGDDFCHETRFEKQLNFLENNPEISVLGSNLYLIDENSKIIGERTYPKFNEAIRNRFLFVSALANPTAMVRKKDLEDIGLFDESLGKAEDLELWLRFLAKNKLMHNLQDKLVYYRIQTGRTENRNKLHWEKTYLVRKHYSKIIWPSHKRIISQLAYLALSRLPSSIMCKVLNLSMVNKIKRIGRP